ncbi:parvulin-like peptidyl-prolyl isomerase [Nostoc sp. PCC 7524]|uniref:peptidylprolyl isomerase n=1 Tax=Nostoc sp. (strain ATCC 29411 / PCC 7524) TaxID=28072 RepID=UPI00029F2A85|nr:peptidylprolyl isomerase [Nostoc sp. PCC 7524]AFY48707.1 parvulin-like peptidyl-prolyl isomerase [Nostoc sp. PCC 7524]
MIEFNGEIITPREVVTYLKKTLQIKEVCNNVLYQKIINTAAQERDIKITEAEIQIEADRLRYEKRLVKASDTIAWLVDQLVLSEDWEAGILDSLLSKKLAVSLFAKDVEKYFLENQLDYDQVLLYQIVVSNKQLAQEICYQIEEGEISFYEAAHIYDIDQRRRNHCGYEGKFYRWSLKPDVAAVVFNTTPGDLIGPLIIDKVNYILMVKEFIPAELTDERREEIINKMFQEWLAAKAMSF